MPPRYAPGQGIILYTSSNFLFDTTQRCGGTQKRTGMLAEIDVFQRIFLFVQKELHKATCRKDHKADVLSCFFRFRFTFISPAFRWLLSQNITSL